MSEPAKATHDEITKQNLKNKYDDDIKFKSEVDKVFPKDDTKIYECTNVKKLLSKNGIDKKFNEVFSAREPAITISSPNNNVYVYRDEIGVAMNRKQNRSIIIVCTACVIEEATDYKIVIASRLDTRHSEDEKKLKGGGTEAQKIFEYIEKNLNANVKSATVLNEGDLEPSFINIMSDPLISKSNTEFKSEFIEYTVNKEVVGVDIKSLTFKKKKIIKFKVTFLIIYDENEDKIYYSRTFDKNTIYILSDTFDGTYKKKNATAAITKEDKGGGGGGGGPPPAVSAALPSLIEGYGEYPTHGGGKRKLTRKQLNIMTLTELKQLHKVNKIKMNNNRTIKALINNYIKNYKKKIISNTKIGR